MSRDGDSDTGKRKIEIVGVAALVGAKRTTAKPRASRANGRLGGPLKRRGQANDSDESIALTLSPERWSF